MEAEIPALQSKILAEERNINERMREIEENWKDVKPQSGNLEPNKALEFLSNIVTKVQKLKEDNEKVGKAKEVLDMDPSEPSNLENLEEEIVGLREVWSELAKVWTVIESVRETPWSAVVHKKIREVLTKAVEEMSALPSRLRQYEAYENMKTKISRLMKTNKLISELKSESLRERHWKTLNTRLKLRKPAGGELNLGHVWDADPLKHEKFI